MRIAVIALLFGVTWPALAAAQGIPSNPTPEQIEEGALVYAENCAACHGANLEGQPDWRSPNKDGRLPAPPHDASGHTWHHDDQTLFGITKLGTAKFTGLDIESDMKGFGSVLSDAEIWSVLAYIKSKWPARIRRQQEQINRRAAGR